MRILKLIGKPFVALAGKADSSLEAKILTSLARHGATALGAYLVTKGVIDAGHVQTFVGALLTMIGTVSGGVQKIVVEE